MMDWDALKVEEILDVLAKAPNIAGIWTYDSQHLYVRKVLWSREKGTDNGWSSAASVWKSSEGWFCSVKTAPTLGPFDDRFVAAEKIDEELRRQGWRLMM